MSSQTSFDMVIALPFRSIERGHDMGAGAIPDGRGERLARQHMRAVKGAVDHAVEQDFPIRLCLSGNEQPFVLKIALFIGHGRRGHVGQFDKAEFQLVHFKVKLVGQGGAGQQRGGQQTGKRAVMT